MPKASPSRSRRSALRELLIVFLPIAATVAVATVGTALFLSAEFMAQAMRSLEEDEGERLGTAMRTFSRINQGSVPVFLSAMAEDPVRDYLYGRGSTIENALRGGERIDRIVGGNEFVDSIYLYNSSSGVLSTSAGLEGKGPQSDSELLGLLSRVREFGLSRYVLRRVAFRGDASPRNLFTMILGYLPEEGARMRAAFVANLSEKRIRAELLGAGSAETTRKLYILDQDGRFLSHPDPNLFGASAADDPKFASILAEGAPQGSRTVRSSVDGVRFLATWVDQREMRWRFVSLSPESAVFAPVLLVRNRVLSAAGIFLLVTIGAALAISRALRARERRNDLAQAYLRGEIGGEARRLFPALRYPCSMALLRVDGYRRLIAEHGSSALFELGGELSAALGTRSRGSEAFRVSENSFLVVVAGDSREARSAVAAAASSIGERRTLALGGWTLSRPLAFEELPDAFHILHEALRLDFLRPEGRIEELESAPPAPKGTAPEAPAMDEARLLRLDKAVRALSAGPEAERQVAILVQLLGECRDPELFRYGTAAAAGKALALLGDAAEEILPGGAASFGAALAQAERLGEAERLLAIAAAALRQRGDLHSDRRQRELVTRVKAIVAHRLAEPSLSTATIAADVGLSASYLRDLFKRLEGMALYDFVGTARLERAKALLLGSKDSVRGICDRSGFINYSYFFTFFKKATGKTPTEFRDEGARRGGAS